MSAEPDYCAECAAVGVIATKHGPTCTHQPNHNAKWFPEWWTENAFDKDDPRRAEWLKQNASKTA